MPDRGSGSVGVLDADPELARELSPVRAREAALRLRARAIEIPRGRWLPDQRLFAETRPIGLLMLGGLLMRETIVGEHPAAELLGAGDLLRAWDDAEHEELLHRTVEWTALGPARVAIIDPAFITRASQWPEIVAALLDRAAQRAERLVVLQAIAHLTRVDDRLIALLWCLAERWGRVLPGGVLVSLPLSHRTLAGMVGARRPSVTTALGRLTACGALERRARGEWLLRADVPEPRRPAPGGNPITPTPLRGLTSAWKMPAPPQQAALAGSQRAS